MEGRKLWMKSTVKDGPTGKVYATARALFVAPSSTRLAKDAVKLGQDGVQHVNMCVVLVTIWAQQSKQA